MQLVTLSEEQQRLYEYIENSKNNIFVTGRAGTGKSTLLSYLIEHSEKRIAVCAPTGVAALNVGGVTIHSLFGFPFGILGNTDLSKHLSRRVRELLQAIDTLVIDEVAAALPVAADRSLDYLVLNLLDNGAETAHGRQCQVHITTGANVATAEGNSDRTIAERRSHQQC